MKRMAISQENGEQTEGLETRRYRAGFSRSPSPRTMLSVIEKSARVPRFSTCSPDDIFYRLREIEKRLRVLEKLRGFSIAADRITTERGAGAYHLVVLDSVKRTVDTPVSDDPPRPGER